MFWNLFKRKQPIEIFKSNNDSDVSKNKVVSKNIKKNIKMKKNLSEKEIQVCKELEFNRRLKKAKAIVNLNNFNKIELDSIIKEAANVIVISQIGSASQLQRKLKIGYNRASRLIDQLESLGIIGSFQGSTNRDVNVKSIAELESVFQTGEFLSENCKLFKTNYLHDFENQINIRIEDYYKKISEENLDKEKEQIRFQILKAENKKKEKERLNTLRNEIENKLSESGEISISLMPKRERIPQDVMDKVWNRDGGKCVQCGKSEKLEFDHIIPHSKGGSNTIRNLQLLCEKCNRVKSNNIG